MSHGLTILFTSNCLPCGTAIGDLVNINRGIG